MTPDPKKLYQQLILQHQKAPVNFFKPERPAQQVEAYNPICGDKFTLYFQIEADCFQSVSFYGFGCSISKAATSVLVEWLEGKSVQAAADLLAEYLRVIKGDIDLQAAHPSFFAAFAMARQFPGRETCATLSWDALAQAIATKD